MPSPSEVLSVDPDASDERIDQAYRERVKEVHPDQGGSKREFLLVRAAYDAMKHGESDEFDDEDDLERYEPTTTSVRYLNYEVLDDHGWSLDDDDLFEKAAAADLDPADYGQLDVGPNESLLEGAESCGYAWPYACRGGACANCAVSMREGELAMPVNHVLPEEMMERDIRLSCMAQPTTEEMTVVYNVKHLPDLEELRLPPRPFEQAYAND